MKLAVVGKGGSGKTTISAVVARTLARRGWRVVALDCDSNPNLGISLGVGEIGTERLVAMRQALDEGEEEHAPSWDQLLERFGVDAPDGVRLGVVTRIENPDPGCPCCGLSPEQLLAHVDVGSQVDGDDQAVVADLEAGIGTLIRMGDTGVDVVLVVVEATPKSLDVGVRAAGLVTERSLGHLVVVANRVRDDSDVAIIREAFGDIDLVAIPDDPAIVEADRAGVAPLDVAPGAPAVQALVALGERISVGAAASRRPASWLTASRHG
ncbi:MAG: nucleotide-binding protein [Acidimicrobiales bacterium]